MLHKASGRKKLILAGIGLLLLVAGVGAAMVLRGGSGAAATPGAPVTQGPTSGAPAGPGETAPALGAVATADVTDPNGKAPVPVHVVAISTGTVSSYITATANLVAENEVKVLAEAEGRVERLAVEEGDAVTRGQVMAELVRDDAVMALEKARLRASNAVQAFERGQAAVAQDLLSRQEFDKLTMENQIAAQELAEARWKLAKTSIAAPFTGRVTKRQTQPGQHVRPGDEMFVVTDFDPLIAAIHLPEKDVLGLRERERVRITMKASESTPFDGRVRQISPVVDIATGTVKVTVEATAPPAHVRPGTFVTVEIVRETRPSVLVLPREAVIRELQDAYVFVADAGVAKRRAVTLGLEESGRIEALSGVKAGDQVIVAGQGGLKDGTVIKVLPETQASALPVTLQRRARG